MADQSAPITVTAYPTKDSKPPDWYVKGIDLERTIPREELYTSEVYPRPIITREQWGALPPKNPIPHETPLAHLRFTDTDSEECHTHEECCKLLREIQKRDMDAGYSDIMNNFMISTDGTLYEGRGWNTQADRPDVEYNFDLTALKGKSFDLAYIGNFDGSMTKEVPWLMMSSAFHYTHWASRHRLLKEMFSITQLRVPTIKMAESRPPDPEGQQPDSTSSFVRHGAI